MRNRNKANPNPHHSPLLATMSAFYNHTTRGRGELGRRVPRIDFVRVFRICHERLVKSLNQIWANTRGVCEMRQKGLAGTRAIVPFLVVVVVVAIVIGVAAVAVVVALRFLCR